MEFTKLLEPYAEPDKDGRPTRTIEGQIKWLNKRGVPRNIIDQAILKVFDELEHGMKFEASDDGTAGHNLDHYLLKTAQELQDAELSKQAKELESFLTTFKDSAVQQYIKDQQSSVWKRIKSVFKP